MSALAVTGLHVHLGGRPVLQGVDLRIDRGEFVALIGPNGAGKTTLLRSVLGLVRARAGAVSIHDRPARSARSSVGYVPQRHEFAWDFPISVEQAVLTGRTAHVGLFGRPGVADWKAVDRALGLVQMHDLRRRPVGELSGGQRQRVLVARALAIDPTVLLLDEPLTGLDMPTQEVLTDLFGSLARDGRTMLMTTHDIPAALFVCDKVALLNRRIVAMGTADELRDSQVWMDTFEIGSTNPLLRVIEAA